MRTILQTANAALADNEIHLFYSFSDERPCHPDKVRLAGLADSTSVADDQISVLRQRYSNDAIWVPGEAIKISSDLAEFARTMLGSNQNSLSQRWILSDRTKRLLTKGDLCPKEFTERRSQKCLTLKLNDIAIDRVKACGIDPFGLLILSIDEVECTSFRTGIDFVVVRISVTRPDESPLSAIELMEAISQIHRVNHVRWIQQTAQGQLRTFSQRSIPSESSADEVFAGNEFSLGNLVRSLTGREDAISGLKRSRVPSYTFARLRDAHSSDECDMLAAYLARRYSTDYFLDKADTTVIFPNEFANVRHAAALEGTATVISRNDADDILPNFLETWKASVYRSAYVPLVLLALHEWRYLRRETNKAQLAGHQSKTLASLKRATQILEEAQDFQLKFRFSQISEITPHNRFSSAIRSAFGLEKLLSELTADIAAHQNRLSAAYEKEKNSRSFFLSVLGSGAIGGFTAIEITQAVQSAAGSDDFSKIFPVMVGVSAMLIAMWFFWRRGHE